MTDDEDILVFDDEGTVIPRRRFLQGSAAAAVAALAGWRPTIMPGPNPASTVPITSVAPPIGVPVDMWRGVVMTVSDAAMTYMPPDETDDYVFDSLTRKLMRDDSMSYKLIAPKSDVNFYRVAPGGDYDDPLGQVWRYGAKQLWEVERIA
jgi:hypothetical protein